MSNSNPALRTYPLEVQAEPAVRVTVLNGEKKAVGSGSGRQTFSLPAGLYLILKELSGVIREEVRLLRGPSGFESMVVIPPVAEQDPPRYTPAPLEGAVTTHEYYEGPSAQYSREMTSSPLGDEKRRHAQLFVFVRAVEQGRVADRDLARGLSLFGPSGEQVDAFDPEGERVRLGNGAGWLAFSADAESAPYLLRYHEPQAEGSAGRPSRDVPIPLFSGWQTQVFIIHDGSPRLDGLRVFLAPKGQGFHATSLVADAVNLATDSLQNGTELPPQWALQALLKGKFENPLLGLIGAHCLLREPEPRVRVIREVLGNLERLLPDSADVRALRIMAARIIDEPVDPSEVTEVPLLRPGLIGVIEASAEFPSLVPASSLIDRVAPRLYADSAWSSWNPLPDLGADPPPVSTVGVVLLNAVRAGNREPGRLTVEAIARDRRLTVHNVRHALEALTREQDQITELATNLGTTDDDASRITALAAKILAMDRPR